tara:strand:+ start:106 stop:627 length:522 start_codon:yes stop_codon:yes gene_type:complete
MKNNIISENIRVRVPEFFKIGEHSIIDDFSYFSTKIKVGKYSHIGNNVSIAGGASFQFTLGDYSSISSGVRVWCASDNFYSGIASFLSDDLLFDDRISGDVWISDLTIIGTNSVIMPNNTLPIGVALGALSFVPYNFNFEPWMLYAGIPIKPIRKRDEKRILGKYHQMKNYEK